ncbi:T9SS C-terminal target domain-containing protein [Fibrisoma montanum]|uniref:T9SS C-terminal target domain-containing protein n=1 Tax=Fibrisoma montanum TaxID=2305895 RepID=A0A418MEK7_9BACT|nr:M12 family metallo-peptidase [Fibrisoma montanum]RIV25195.1 T9SS C-terminal target domain-containing protein [Fibrisoma montanum]
MTLFYRLALLGLFSFFWLNTSAQNLLPCGVNDRVLPDSTVRLMGRLPQLMAQQRARKAAGERNICRVAVEIDSDTYVEFDKDTNRIKSFFLDKIEQTSRIYEREINTQLVVVFFHIWKDTEPDPYKGKENLYDLWPIMDRIWTTTTQLRQVPYDKRIYFITKQSSGAGGLGSLGGAQIISANQGDLNTIAHEFGHTFGSPHTHNCSWPGGPIDFCSTVEATNTGDCYTGSLQTIPGTIMSYCGSLLTFHPLCQTLMTDHAVRNFAKVTSAPTVPALRTQETLYGTPFLTWASALAANRYDIEVATDANFAQKIVSDTASVNGYLLSKLSPGQTYYVRVRASNSFGTSAWSAAGQLQLAPTNTIAAPLLLSPTPDQRFSLNQGNRQFSVQPVDGATNYEIQITDGNDELFKYPSTDTRPQAAFSVSNYRFGVVRWRVRAVVNGRPGPWSAPGRYLVNPEPYYLIFPFYNNASDLAPLTVPYLYYTTTGQSSRVVATLATDSLFTKPVYTKSFTGSYTYSGLLEKLSPNTTYYLKLEEFNTELATRPVGLLTRLVQSFRTGSATVSDRWAFVGSSTMPTWPQGTAYGPVSSVGNNIWYSSSNGLTRITQDSLKLTMYDRNGTSGKVGNSSLAHSVDGSGNVWVTNRVSINIFKDGFPLVFNQLGKLSEQDGALTERTTFTTGKYGINRFNANPKLFISYNGLQEQKGDSLTSLYALPSNRSISRTLVQAGAVWFISNNPDQSVDELIRVDLVTRTTQTFSNSNTPQLGRYLLGMAVDGLGNLWVSQSHTTFPFPALARFNGQSWTTLTSPAIPISYALNLTNDPQGNLYVINNSVPRTLYRYNGTTWQKLADMPYYTNLGDMTADIHGNVWFGGPFQLLRYTACANAPKPTLSTTKQTVEYGESVTLQAAGCTDVVWSWTSEAETVTNRLVRGSNRLVVKPEANTTYRSSCYTGSCAGTDTTLSITVNPRLSLSRLNKSTYCPGDSLVATYSLLGKAGVGNQYAVIVKSGGQTTRYTAATRTATVATVLPVTLAPGRYVVYLEATQPALLSRDSIQITVSALPTAELSSNKPTFVLGDSARVSVALTGAAPWRFTRWDNQSIQTATSPYTTVLRATQPTNYSLTLTNLSDANCASGTVKNSVVVSALALANEPLTIKGLSVFPNPTTNRLIIELTSSAAPLSSLHLNDTQGREVRRQAIDQRLRRAEWDISTLPTGQYILRIETTDGKQAIWKVMKQ